MNDEPWQCQQCGAPIGYLGRFLRGLLGARLYQWLIGCNQCRAEPMKGDE